MGKYSSGRRGGPAKTVGGRKFSRKFKSSLTRHFLFLNFSPFEKKLCAVSEKITRHFGKIYNLDMQNNKKYLNKIYDEIIKYHLEASAAIVIKGPIKIF